MKYQELIEQSYDFPTEEFRVENNALLFHGIPLKELAEEYGTPLKLTYLPKISENIQKIRTLFHRSMAVADYQGKYHYAYCTKSSHFEFVLRRALREKVHLETSSAYDMAIIPRLHEKGHFPKDRYIICNGFKRELYQEKIVDLLKDGYENLVIVLDNMEEIAYYKATVPEDLAFKVKLGLRLASDEEPGSLFYTNRLGIRPSGVLDYYRQEIKDDDRFELHMFHYFVHSGIRDTTYYWKEFGSFFEKYCELKKICPSLKAVDLGGGLPIKTSFDFEYDYAGMVEQIVKRAKAFCDEHQIEHPDLFTEFGSFTVGESGAVIYKVLGQKQQNDKEFWYMIDSSFITTLPDIWGLNQKYLMLAINRWEQNFKRVNLGGLSCDNLDYYNSEAHINEVYLPEYNPKEPFYLGFFHTGAYQESIGGYGGIQHCLIPAPKHIIIDREEGELSVEVFRDEQTEESMLDILGY